jgi:hypothetical protein
VAAPLLFRMFEALPMPESDVAGPAPEASALSAEGMPQRLARFESEPLSRSRQPLRIAFPLDGSTVIAQRSRGGPLSLPISVQGGTPPYQVYVDDLPLDGPQLSSRLTWSPPGRGAARLVATDAAGARATANVWVEDPASPVHPAASREDSR